MKSAGTPLERHSDIIFIKSIRMLQFFNRYNHSSPSVTMRYIGINQDIIDEAVDDLVYKIVQFLIQARYM